MREIASLRLPLGSAPVGDELYPGGDRGAHLASVLASA
jgi:hypothetical protein